MTLPEPGTAELKTAGDLAVDDDQPQAPGFSVTLDAFSGPFDLLLGLIAKRQMDVTTVALAEVTDEFIAYVRTLDDDRALEESSQFVFVAATLLDLKIAQLLPGGQVEDEEDIAVLEARDLLFARLLQYRAFKEIAAQIGQAAEDQRGRFPRRPGTHPDLAGMMPELVFKTGPEDLKALAERALARQSMEPDHVRLEHLHAPEVSVEVEKAVMTDRLRQVGGCTFAELVVDPDSGEPLARIVVVVRFLALLELFRDRQVDLNQLQPLGLLDVRWAGSHD